MNEQQCLEFAAQQRLREWLVSAAIFGGIAAVLWLIRFLAARVPMR